MKKSIEPIGKWTKVQELPKEHKDYPVVPLNKVLNEDITIREYNKRLKSKGQTKK